MKLLDVNVKISRVIIICLIVSLLTGIVVYAAVPTQPFTITRGVYPGAPSYTVWEEDGTFYAKNSWGVIAYAGTAADVINAAAASLTTNGGTIYLLGGEYPLGEETIVIDNPKVFLEGENWETTKITATNNAINITDAVGSGVKNLCLEGSDVAESIGIFISAATTYDTVNRISYVGIANFGYGIYVSLARSNMIDHVNIAYCVNTGIQLVATDNKVTDFEIGWCDIGLRLEYDANLVSQGNIWGSGLGATNSGYDQIGIVVSGSQNQLTNVETDNNGLIGVQILGGNNSLTNVISRQNGAAGGWPNWAFNIYGSKAKHNLLVACTGGNINSPQTNAVGLVEGVGCDYNQIIACNFMDNTLAGIGTVGANTKVSLTWNNTSWIA